MTECPVKGTVSTCASGISAATWRAFAVGVRRSWVPERMRVGTFGRGPGAGGAAEASGHCEQSGISPFSKAVLVSNG